VQTLWDKKKKKFDLKSVSQNSTQLISRHSVRKTRYEAGTGIVRLLSKASNTGFSRQIKTGCNLPVCIANFDAIYLNFGAKIENSLFEGCEGG